MKKEWFKNIALDCSGASPMKYSFSDIGKSENLPELFEQFQKFALKSFL